MNAMEHQQEAERLLRLAKEIHAELGSAGVDQMTVDLLVTGQMVAMAHVHALLAVR